MYYTYAYLRENKTPYYIGKGSGGRAYQKHIRNNRQNLVPKNKNQILILKKFELEEDAYKHEQYLIALYGRKCDGGILVNMVHGGKGGARKYLTRKEKEAAILRNKIRAVKLIKEWRKENREEFNRKTNERNAKRRKILNQRQKEYANKNREKINEKQKEYREKNREELRRKEREYYAKNKERIQARKKELQLKKRFDNVN
jgi:hypothetical protein